MSKKPMIIVAVIVVLALVGGGVYFATKKNNTATSSTTASSSSNTATTSTKPTGNAEVQAVLDKVKTNTPTVTATRVVTEATDPNNYLGKSGQYQFVGSFYDTRAKSSEAVTDNYATTSGGSIEIFSNNGDSATRGAYLAQFQTGAVQAGAYKVVGNVVLRVSENYTASQQTEMLTLMESAL
jgi:hypothetical protein